MWRDPEDDGLDIERFVGVLAETAKPRLSHSVIWQHKALCASLSFRTHRAVTNRRKRTEHGCRESPRQKIEAALINKARPFLRASLRTKGKRVQRFCQVTRECPVKFPRREGHLFLPVEDGPARVGRSTLRAPRLRAQAQQRERSKPEIAAGRSLRRRRVRAPGS